MQTFNTLFDAIAQAEEELCSAVDISATDGMVVIFSSRLAPDNTFTCIVDDGYYRTMTEQGKIIISPKTRSGN